ncbi:unnamed protein product [Cochlearia groenlandica]
MGNYSYNLSDPTQAPGFYDDGEEEVTSRDPYDDAMEFGVPTICYCGREAILATATSPLNSARRFYTCPSRDWWDVAVMEELRKAQDMARNVDVYCRSQKEEKLHSMAVLESLVKKSRSEIDDLRKTIKMGSICLVGLLVGMMVVVVFK